MRVMITTNKIAPETAGGWALQFAVGEHNKTDSRRGTPYWSVIEAMDGPWAIALSMAKIVLQRFSFRFLDNSATSQFPVTI